MLPLRPVHHGVGRAQRRVGVGGRHAGDGCVALRPRHLGGVEQLAPAVGLAGQRERHGVQEAVDEAERGPVVERLVQELRAQPLHLVGDHLLQVVQRVLDGLHAPVGPFQAARHRVRRGGGRVDGETNLHRQCLHLALQLVDVVVDGAAQLLERAARVAVDERRRARHRCRRLAITRATPRARAAERSHQQRGARRAAAAARADAAVAVAAVGAGEAAVGAATRRQEAAGAARRQRAVVGGRAAAAERARRRRRDGRVRLGREARRERRLGRAAQRRRPATLPPAAAAVAVAALVDLHEQPDRTDVLLAGVRVLAPRLQRLPDAQVGGVRVGELAVQVPDGRVGVGCQQHLHHARLSRRRRPVQRRAAVLVLAVDLRARLQQRAHGVDLARLGRQVQRRPPVLVGRVHVGAVREQQFEQRAVAAARRQVERLAAVDVARADVSAALEQQPRAGRPARHRGGVQRRAGFEARRGRYAGALAEQQRQDGQVSAARRQVDRRAVPRAQLVDARAAVE